MKKGTSDWVFSERSTRGLSQAKFSKIVGIAQPVISACETGKRDLSAPQVDLIQRALSRFDRDLAAGRVQLYTKQLSREPGNGNGSAKKPPSRRTQPEDRIDFLAAAKEKFASNPDYYQSRNTPRAISLFTGCGGLCLGFRMAGFRVLGYVELEAAFRRTYELNFPEPICLGSDIRNVSDSDLAEYHEMFGDVDVVFGGPPCQGFSLAGKRDPADHRNTLFEEQVRFIKHFSPKVVLMENVRLLTSMKAPDGRLVTSHVLEAFDRAGYVCEFAELNAQDHGVPQFRERVIFIAVRKGLQTGRVEFPEATHGPSRQQSLFGGDKKPYRTFGDATRDLETLESGEASRNDPYHWAVDHPAHVLAWLKDVPEGRSAHENEDPTLRPPCGYNTTYKRLVWDEPCSTIGTTFGMISACRTVHPRSTRSLTVREALRCQTFPDDFQLKGTWGDIRAMIGNAVPPLLGKVLAAHILERYLATDAAATRVAGAHSKRGTDAVEVARL